MILRIALKCAFIIANVFLLSQDAITCALRRSDFQTVFSQTISAPLEKDSRTRSCLTLAAPKEMACTALFLNVRQLEVPCPSIKEG